MPGIAIGDEYPTNNALHQHPTGSLRTAHEVCEKYNNVATTSLIEN